MVRKALDGLSMLFAGAVLALLLAKHGYGATGLDKPQNIAYAGLVLSLGALALFRWTRS